MFGRVTGFLSILRRNFKIRKENRKSIRRFKRYIQNGIYYLDNSLLSKHPICVYARTDLVSVKFFIFSLKKDNKNVCGGGQIFVGTYKRCFINGDKVFSYCHNKNVYMMNKNNYLTYAEKCPYPYAKNFWYNDRKKMICSEYISGEVYRDKQHLVFWAKSVLKMAQMAECKFEDGLFYYIQHGDAWYDNIKWVNDEKFIYIDLDRLGFWPALYDIIYGLTVAFQDEAFNIIENELFDTISELFVKKGLVFSIEEMDKYYSAFIRIWAKRDKNISAKYIKPFYGLDNRYIESQKVLSALDVKKG